MPGGVRCPEAGPVRRRPARAPESHDLFAAGWVAAWNSHDVERILAHYAPEVAYHSPFVAGLGCRLGGALFGRAALREHVEAGLRRYPELRFRLLHVYAGVGSLVIEYENVNGLRAAEAFVLDGAGRACQVFCHYRSGEGPAPSSPPGAWPS
jgi:SnoaL-like domain